MTAFPELPVCEVLPKLAGELGETRRAVLVAPPGAGKTTLVPLYLLDQDWLAGQQIILVEPRRLAARAATRRMAALMGENTGETAGYAMRFDRQVSGKTRILVVTEGVFSRMAVDNPDLPGVGAVLFDEFHERSLDADFGLALALDIAGGLRPDLRIAVMSATLDGARIAALMGGAPVIESSGRSNAVDIRYRERPPNLPVEDAMAGAVRDALAAESGSILAFLPGQGEIARTVDRLDGYLSANVDLLPLHGGLDGKAQDLAIRPSPEGRRKVVLATSIAESSITIDGVRIVIDCGLSRQPRYEPGTGITRLETVRVSQASATQRAGRAGRNTPGIAIRLWNERLTKALPEFDPPEILQADLSGLMLDCAELGVTEIASMRFADMPPKPALAEARELLRSLQAIDEMGRITAGGRIMRKIGLPVRLAHMVAAAGSRQAAEKAARLALVISERGLGGNAIDLDERLRRLEAAGDERSKNAKRMAAKMAGNRTFHSADRARETWTETTGALLAAAYPDRIGKARGTHGHFVLASGRGGYLDAAERLAGAAFIVAADLQGKARNQRIAAAAELDEADIRNMAFLQVNETIETFYDREARSVRARLTGRLGAITLSERQLPAPSGPEADRAVFRAIKENGLSILPWNQETRSLRARLGWLHARFGPPWPDVSNEALTERAEEWLGPYLTGNSSPGAYSGKVLGHALSNMVPAELSGQAGKLAPQYFRTPAGRDAAIRYDEGGPVLAVRVQEMFGLKIHPAIGDGDIPLTLELLSPAGRPIQTTRDLPGFWKGSWAAVRAEMRGRYPKHDWPADPASQVPSTGAKPRQ